MKTNKEKLKELRKLLAVKKRWTRDTFARNKNNVSCEPVSKNAVSWCLYGGCERVGITNPAPLFSSVLMEGMANFNDNRKTTHKKLLKVIDRVIKLCKT